RFSTRMEVKELALPPLREFLLAYALIDVRAGTFAMASEIEAADGRYEGYVKPFFENLEFESIPDPDKNLVQRAATRVASAVTGLLENERDQVATKAPFEGNFESNDLVPWTTIENLLRNAFVEALR